MGIDIEQYRTAIGRFNAVKYVNYCYRLGMNVEILALYILLVILLVLSGDVEVNPGPQHSTLKVRALTACHVNIRGLNSSKLNAIAVNLAPLYDIITLSETFLSKQSEDFVLSGYCKLIRKDRPTFGGGVAAFIKENIYYKRKCNYEAADLESLWFELDSIDGKILLCNVYRPPNNSDFWPRFENIIEEVIANNNVQYIVILGDLNADFSTPDGTKLKALTQKFGLICHVNEPTRITQTSSTCLDQIITNMPNFVSCINVQAPVSTNDHCTVGVKFRFKIYNEESYFRHIWIYKEGNYEGFRQALSEYNWDDCFQGSDIDSVCDKWTKTLL